MDETDPKPRNEGSQRSATSLLEQHPDFPNTNVEIYDAIIARDLDNKLKNSLEGSDESMEVVLEMVDIRAQAFLRLVTDISYQRAYVVLLTALALTAWQDFAGCPITAVPILSQEQQRHWQAIIEKRRYWENEGFRQLAKASSASHHRKGDTAGDGAPTTKPNGATEPKADATDAHSTPPEALKDDRARKLVLAQNRWEPIAKRTVPFVWVHEAANVDHKDAYIWKSGKLPDSSVMARNIERILEDPNPPSRPVKK
jgi:hypothetical protein